MTDCEEAIGTYYGVTRAQLRVYLGEFVLRSNRQNQPMAPIQALLSLGSGQTLAQLSSASAG